jgi:hypothetical protein
VQDKENDEQEALRIVTLIKKGVKAANPFFKWMAAQAVQESKINIRNVGGKLFDRYVYFRDAFRATLIDSAQARADEKLKSRQLEFDIHLYSVRERARFGSSELVAKFMFPSAHISAKVSWLALAAIDAFFAWTEHIFIHIAILQGTITSVEQVTKIVGAEWKEKFKCAIDLSDPVAKRYLDRLIVLRRQLRNFVAHGAFGKDGEAFNFHSGAGAVPVALDYTQSKPQFSLSPELAFDDEDAIELIEEFIPYLWSGKREPAQIYIQEGLLPLILPRASDGAYAAAMASVDDMREFVDHLGAQLDRSADMDW